VDNVLVTSVKCARDVGHVSGVMMTRLIQHAPDLASVSSHSRSLACPVERIAGPKAI